MLLYNRKEAISVRFKKHTYEIDLHNDIALDVLEHFNYVQDIDLLDIEFLGDGSHIVECDYCGKRMIRNWTSKEQGGKGGKLGQTYVSSKKDKRYGTLRSVTEEDLDR